ncbi:MAG: sensor histidine kinase [Paenibacillus sp.]|nr:sensor histidine kinase [Paenibacillus sp.]
MERGPRPDSWLIGVKLVLLLYVAIASYDQSRSAWETIALLLYVCLDLLGYILRVDVWRKAAQALTVLFVAAAAVYIEPVMALLAPIPLFGLAASVLSRPAPIYALAFLPLFALPDNVQLPYGLIAALGLLFHMLHDSHVRKTATAKELVEKLREENNRLAKSLVDSNEYIRQSEYTFKLEERNRLSQDIHDKIGHSMTGALIQMEAAKRLQAADPVRSAELLQNAIAISKDGIENIRQVLRDTKPLAEQLGLNRLRLFIDEFGATRGLRATLTFDGEIGRIEPLHWRIIHQNVTEALTNTAKYAGATSVSVHIEVLNTMVKTRVADNGSGASKVIKGLGIAGMEERAATAGGKVIVDGSDGFSVTTLLPCERP